MPHSYMWSDSQWPSDISGHLPHERDTVQNGKEREREERKKKEMDETKPMRNRR